MRVSKSLEEFSNFDESKREMGLLPSKKSLSRLRASLIQKTDLQRRHAGDGSGRAQVHGCRSLGLARGDGTCARGGGEGGRGGKKEREKWRLERGKQKISLSSLSRTSRPRPHSSFSPFFWKELSRDLISSSSSVFLKHAVVPARSCCCLGS